MQRLVNLSPEIAKRTPKSSRQHVVQMNLAALVVPGVISFVCVLVGLMTLHEYCVGGDLNAEEPRCFFHDSRIDRVAASVSASIYSSRIKSYRTSFLSDAFAAESRTLSYAKIAAISFYAASLLTTMCTVIFPGTKVGPLKTSLALYHILICSWSTLYYSLDFFELVPLVRSERDGMLEYSAVRVLAVWPVTSTLMISKIAVLSMMTRRRSFNMEKKASTDGLGRNTNNLPGHETHEGNGDDSVANMTSVSRLYPFAQTFKRLLRARSESD